MAVLIGVLLASTLLFVRHSAPARAGGDGRYRGLITKRARLRTRPRTSRRAPDSSSKPARHAHAPTARPAEDNPPPRLKQPPTIHQEKTKQPTRTNPATPAPAPSKPVDTNAPEQSPLDQREITDDLIEALRPDVEPVEHPQEELSTPQRAAHPLRVKHFEADPKSSKAVRHAPPRRREGAAQQYCQIRLWRGYFKCQFYAELEGSPGALAESSLFRLRNPNQPGDQIQRALENLLAELERSGWSIVESGPVWYRHRLQRSLVDAPW